MKKVTKVQYWFGSQDYVLYMRSERHWGVTAVYDGMPFISVWETTHVPTATQAARHMKQLVDDVKRRRNEIEF